MKKLYTIFLIITLASGCNDNLELNPTNTLTPETLLDDPDNLDRLLIGAYAFAVFHHSGEFQTISELLANEGNLAFRGTFPELFQFERKEVIATNGFVRFLWANSYRSINLCNIVLDNLDLVENPIQRAQLEGEAKFMRGLLYFEMVRYFALPYEAVGNNTQIGLPIVFDAVTDVSQLTYPNRNTVEEVYIQALSDLQDAYSLLPTDNESRADAYAAQAILARVYLQQGNYSAARDAAHDVLQNSGHALTPNLPSAFNNESNGIEDIFAWQVTTQDGVNEFNTYWATIQFGGRSQTADVTVEPPFFDLFTGIDDRANFFYEGNGTLVSSKWQGQFANVPFIRIAEMHLIRAESNFREGSNLGLTPEDEVNALRARSNAAPILGVSLQDILEERQRELAFEGHRFHDAKRLQEDIDGQPYDAPNLVMPIPQDDIDTNPNLVQNPGYSN
jgi:tetratricopeptide (TPR) repeat protein